MLAIATRCCSPPDRANGSRPGEMVDPEPGEHRVDPAVHLGPRHPQVLEPEGELLADRELRRRELVRRRREDDPDPAEDRAPGRRVEGQARRAGPGPTAGRGRPAG